MKKVVVALALVVLFGAGFWHLATAEAEVEPAEFELTVTLTENGATMTSDHGCAWKELTYECKAKPCSFVVNGSGVRGVRTPDRPAR